MKKKTPPTATITQKKTPPVTVVATIKASEDEYSDKQMKAFKKQLIEYREKNTPMIQPN